jgi:hypothetical protein
MIKIDFFSPLSRIKGNDPFRAEIIAVVTVVACATGKAS